MVAVVLNNCCSGSSKVSIYLELCDMVNFICELCGHLTRGSGTHYTSGTWSLGFSGDKAKLHAHYRPSSPMLLAQTTFSPPQTGRSRSTLWEMGHSKSFPCHINLLCNFRFLRHCFGRYNRMHMFTFSPSLQNPKRPCFSSIFLGTSWCVP